jgi:hypothetical protein
MANYGKDEPGDRSFDDRKKEAVQIIDREYRRQENKEIARDVCARTGIILTPREVEDIYRGGW